jgi:hypothetical protein
LLLTGPGLIILSFSYYFFYSSARTLQSIRNTDATTSSSGFMGFMARGGIHDYESERKVSLAAQSLGEGVQSIVLAAKEGWFGMENSTPRIIGRGTLGR